MKATHITSIPIDAFRAAVAARLGNAPDTISPGSLQRFNTSGKRGDSSAWCLLFADGEAGMYGDWRSGLVELWSAPRGKRRTPEERAALERQIVEARAERQRKQAADWQRNATYIERLWRCSRPVTEGDPVHRYLRRRLRMDDYAVTDALRYHPAMRYSHEGTFVGSLPCMVAPIVGQDGTLRALHRTYLTLDGRKAEVPGPVKKLTCASGPLKGASIRLYEPRASVLGVSEGIETALAASCASSVPTVAAYSAGALADYQWPPGVRRLVILADADDVGRKAAASLQARAVSAGLQVSLLVPSTQGTDWCDVWAARPLVGEVA